MSAQTLHFDEAINPYGCSPRVVDAMVAFARSKAFRWYGEESMAESLRAQLAERFDLSADNFVVYNGAGEGVAWVYILYLVLHPGGLIVPNPSYERFTEAGKLCTNRVAEVPLNADFSLPVNRLIEEARASEATVGLISNPNNPSGNVLVDAASLRVVLDELPDCLWIIDEAFADYTGVTFVPWVRERANLVVLRTFSKAYGLAGLRVGYAAAHRSIAARLERFRIPWGVDSMALVAAAAAFQDQDYLRESVSRIQADVETFRRAIAEIPHCDPQRTSANFFLVRFDGIDAERVRTQLESNRVKVRSRPDMPSYIRVTSMLPEDNRRFVEILKRLLG